ncbi:MAG: hypothetical protein HYV95_07250 [Opitutae bacterium]|nr:hypothetical protein [Opitutae bacterium]
MSADVTAAEASTRAPTLPPRAKPARVTAGEVWRGDYEVVTPFGAPAGRWFRAVRLRDSREVWLRVSSAATAAERDRVWQKLVQLKSPRLQRPLEAHDGIERVEVWEAPDGIPLRAARQSRGAPGRGEITALVRQLVPALEALHVAGLGHFGLNLENLFVRDGDSGVEFILGGFDSTELLEQEGLVPITVDPFFAPPEAAGLFKHTPGAALASWDWWSLGRILQEYFLGFHVIALLSAADRARLPRDLPAQAEALLFERDTGTLRPGGVELMDGLDAATALLLRGLLTGARDARWSAAEVQAWLAGETPEERYNLPRTERLFRWRGKGYTVAEAAQLFRGPEHWREAAAQIFEDSREDTLAFFLRETRAHKQAHERVQTLVQLAQSPTLRVFPEALLRDVIAALALQALSGGDFLWRGLPLSAVRLRAQLGRADQAGQTRAELGALAAPPVLPLMHAQDPAAGQLLETLVKTAMEAEGIMARSAPGKAGAKHDPAELWLLALEPENVLAKAHDKLREGYACSTVPALEKIFTAAQPTRGMLVVLAWAGREPGRHGFLTHAEMKRRRLAQLAERGRWLAQLIFWLRLERVLRAGPLLFGRRWLLAAGWLALVLTLAVHEPGLGGVALGLLPVGALALLRLGAGWWQARVVRKWAPGADAWTWRAGRERCRTEAASFAGQHGLPDTLGAATKLFGELGGEMKALARPEPVDPLPRPPRHAVGWLAVGLSWVLAAGLVAGSAWRAARHPPSWVAHQAAWRALLPARPAPETPPAGDVKISWPYREPLETPFEITVQGAFTPTGAQLAAAIARGRGFVQGYKPETITSYIAIYVPLEGDKGGLLLFDGKRGVMMGRNGVLINFVPLTKTWMQIGDQRALFIEK